MAGYRDCQSTEIAASPEDCYAALTDFEHLPAWQGAVRRAEVLERDEEGRGLVVEYEIDAKVRTVRYTLRQIHQPPQRLGCEYLGGDFRDFYGEWRFTGLQNGRTGVELELRIDPGRFVPRPLRAAVSDAVMRRALRDLKRHLERQRAPSSTSTTS
ncbi:MAG TPA: SRPBCC family protein [Solirubrobacteraceae bacterium]|jgi:ribosome-associated toxin RatA of RatAB toxin-antitoxin module|nr:SRPBCC family protein [Solirubrobacteraceae bacterium]